jgi:hypothetical protein
MKERTGGVGRPFYIKISYSSTIYNFTHQTTSRVMNLGKGVKGGRGVKVPLQKLFVNKKHVDKDLDLDKR